MIHQKTATTEVHLCRVCNGTTKVRIITAEECYTHIPCDQCNGTGRELVTITKQYKPFKI